MPIIRLWLAFSYDANFIIKNGTYAPELNGYVRFMGGQKYGFVGLDHATGDITTFHIKTVSELIKNAPSLELGKDEEHATEKQ